MEYKMRFENVNTNVIRTVNLPWAYENYKITPKDTCSVQLIPSENGVWFSDGSTTQQIRNEKILKKGDMFSHEYNSDWFKLLAIEEKLVASTSSISSVGHSIVLRNMKTMNSYTIDLPFTFNRGKLDIRHTHVAQKNQFRLELIDGSSVQLRTNHRKGATIRQNSISKRVENGESAILTCTDEFTPHQSDGFFRIITINDGGQKVVENASLRQTQEIHEVIQPSNTIDAKTMEEYLMTILQEKTEAKHDIELPFVFERGVFNLQNGFISRKEQFVINPINNTTVEFQGKHGNGAYLATDNNTTQIVPGKSANANIGDKFTPARWFKILAIKKKNTPTADQQIQSSLQPIIEVIRNATRSETEGQGQQNKLKRIIIEYD